ncbi:ABC macrolide family export system permease 2 [Cellvibrio zantedeschiae]|uniref:ABC macrolide family export system permease 2 n=2 Tax=Cellvibrio zantedeschiae TaxID=1237077 RepID=A0ABQ3B9P1_9GAMM|nr:ABC macrolide family export system permease 2 [Cellvibrio zantedeschiae]
MEQFIHYLSSAWVSIKRAPLPYALTILIMGLGLGVFFSNATFYYWVNHDPLKHKSDKLFFPRIASMPNECHGCEPPPVLSYADIKKLSGSNIPSASAAMFSALGYAKTDERSSAGSATIRFTQKDFFKLFDVPILHGQVWPDNNARMEAILSKAFAEKLFGNNDVVGKSFLLDDRVYTVSAVLDKWDMWPKLYDVNVGGYREPVEDIYLPLELSYDLNYHSKGNTRTYEPINPSKYATEGREKAFHRLQFWVQLDSPEQKNNYLAFMHNLVLDEKKAGRHPNVDTSVLHPMSEIMSAFHIQDTEVKAFALVTLLFLFVCLFNASHLSLNRYMANQYEFSLRRALGASGRSLQVQLLADVFISSIFTLGLACIFSWAGIFLINHFLPGNQQFARWNVGLLFWLIVINFAVNYLMSLYPSLRTSFGNLNLQLKS